MQPKVRLRQSSGRNNNAVNGAKNAKRIEFAIRNQQQGNNEIPVDEMVENVYSALYNDKLFNLKYALKSLFLIGSGAFGCVFRLVTNAKGSLDNPKYPKQLVWQLQKMRKTTQVIKSALIDDYRSDHCLDLVAVKIENLTQTDFEENSIGKINLIREFSILFELFSHPDPRYSLVGFPIPIDFGFTGTEFPLKSLKKVIVYDQYGIQENYNDTYIERNNIFGIRATDVTMQSYLAMELVGPNLDDFKSYLTKHDRPAIFSVQTTFKLMDQVLCRLLVLHRKNMVHLDMKPDNICFGVDKMINTVYLLDFGLSKICSNTQPDCVVGSRRYMSLGVNSFMPPNYIMDIESWFYILVVLLIDYIPWSDEVLSKHLPKNAKEGGAREERLQALVVQAKKNFWNDNQLNDKAVLNDVMQRIENNHKQAVPDIYKVMMDLYEHVKRMRQDFYSVNYTRMNTDIKDEESDLFKRYKAIRKILLHIYDCDFTSKGCCFTNDKDLHRRQDERKAYHPMLVYAVNGRDWKWDWDELYYENSGEDSKKSEEE